MRAIILAGGFGTRLRSVVSDVPKPLAPIGDKPFLAWLIAALAQQGVSEVVLSVHYQWEKIRDYFNANPAPVPVQLVVETAALGTGGALRYVLQQKSSDAAVLALNGDTYVKANIAALYQQHCESQATISMVLRRVSDSGRYGTVEVEDGIITAFTDGAAGRPGLINAGVYVIAPDLFAEALPKAFSFERDFLPPRLAAIKPRAFIAEDYFIDIGIPEDYARAQVELPKLL